MKAEHNRIATALIQWTSMYPGDLASDEAAMLFREAYGIILKQTFMAHLTADLVRIEESLPSVDLDSSWSLRISDPSREKLIPPHGQAEHLLDDETSDETDTRPSTSHSSRKSLLPSTRSASTSSITSRYATPALRRQASGSDPPLSGTASRLVNSHGHNDVGTWMLAGAYTFVLSTDVKEIAMDLTRMQWELFAAVRVNFVYDSVEWS